jgi:alpha-glucoside transport system permease protein
MERTGIETSPVRSINERRQMGLAPTPVAPTQYAARAGLTAARRARGPESPRWGATILFLAPAGLLLLVFLIYPAIYTVLLSFNRGRNGVFEQWIGLDNYTRLFSDPDFINLSTFPPSGALWNNVLWIVFYVSIVIFLGLIIAVVAARVRYESVVKAIVFIPMAIAATALAVIWKFVYSPDANIGFLNAMLGAVGVAPVSWLGDPGIVNFALIAVGIWGSVGFATVILSAAVKSIPAEVIESARVEGATERQIFFRMILPMVSLPMSVLAVTLVVNVIKLFDLIYVMTRGGPGKSSQVIAFTMFQQAFEAGQYGYGSAVAVVMLVLLIPIMIFNVRRFRTASVT